jgi:MFS superfamily sulfate permease-like transporter
MAYALLGSSMTLAVGPVAVVSLMTASALQPLAAVGSADYVTLAMLLSLLSGGMLLLFGALRLGFLAHFLSHPVISGFISGSAILIAVGQIKHLLGVKAGGGQCAGDPDAAGTVRAAHQWSHLWHRGWERAFSAVCTQVPGTLAGPRRG